MALWQTWSWKLRPAPTLGGVRFVPRALACQRHHQRLCRGDAAFCRCKLVGKSCLHTEFSIFFERMLFHGFWIYFAVLRVHWDMRRTMTQEPKEVFGSKVVVSRNQFPRSNQQCPWLHVPVSSHDSMHQPRSNCLAKCRIWNQDPTRLVVMGTWVTLWYTRWLWVGEKSTVFKFGVCP